MRGICFVKRLSCNFKKLIVAKQFFLKSIFCNNFARDGTVGSPRLVSGMIQKRGPSVFPIALPTVLRDDLRLSPSTVGSDDWFQE